MLVSVCVPVRVVTVESIFRVILPPEPPPLKPVPAVIPVTSPSPEDELPATIKFVTSPVVCVTFAELAVQ